jgi:hypothetical protein
VPDYADCKTRNPDDTQRPMRRDASRNLLEDQQEGDATHDRKYNPIEPPMQPVQALQIPQQVLRAGFWRGLLKGD